MQPLRGSGSLFVDLGGYMDDDFDWKQNRMTLTNAHLLWSISDLVRQYGAPDRVKRGTGGLTLIYEGPTGLSLDVRFLIDEGVVSYVDFDSR